MSFKVLFIFVLRILFVPFAVTQTGRPPSIVCVYVGQMSESTYILSVNDVPERCEAVSYSGYCLDSPECLVDSDRRAIQSLVAAGKIVFTRATFSLAGPTHWDKLLNSNFTTTPNEQIEKFITFIKTYKIKGVLLARLELFDLDLPDYANKLNAFIRKLKKDVPSLMVGMYVNANHYDKFGNKEKFDFSAINGNVDYYVINAINVIMPCTPSTAKTGRFVLAGGSNGVISLDQVLRGIKSSPMDKKKVVMNFVIQPSSMENDSVIISYSEYCLESSADSSQWCVDSTKLFYDEVQLSKSNINGMFLSILDADDTDGSCGCGLFPVANTYIDAWQSKPMKDCHTIG